jgi:hypothetical protein
VVEKLKRKWMMNITRAKEIIEQDVANYVYFWNESNPDSVTLDGEFDIETLEAVIVVIKQRIKDKKAGKPLTDLTL